VDDIHALMVAMAHVHGPRNGAGGPPASLEAVSVVDGNIGVRQGVANVRRCLRLSPRAVDVLPGAEEPILGRTVPSDEYFGKDGLGDCPDLPPALRPGDLGGGGGRGGGHAALRLVERAREMPGELVVVCLGPLTNLALACLVCPELPELLAEVHVMGGAVAAGNVTPHAEFNFYFDAVAADLVLRKFVDVRLYTWDLAKEATVPWPQWDRVAGLDAPVARFATGIAGKALAGADRGRTSGYVICDPLCVVGALEPASLTLGSPKRARVVVQGDARGKLVIGGECAGGAGAGGRGSVFVVEHVDPGAVVRRFCDATSNAGEWARQS